MNDMERPRRAPGNGPQQLASVPASHAPEWLLLGALFAVGMNLRPAIACVAPLLEAIRTDLGLSAAGAGFLSALPVLCFGLLAPLAPRLGQWLPAERVIYCCLLVLMLGIGLRSASGAPGLFFGTFLIGASISIVMTLLPGLIKQFFPGKAAFTTGLYTTAMNLGAAMASGMAVPVARLEGGTWRLALGVWALPVALLVGAATAAWRIRRGRQSGAAAPASAVRKAGKVRSLRGNPLAWQVALYMGLQSALAYCVFAWLPAMLADRNVSPLSAGFMLSLSIAAQLVTSLTGPWLATRGRDQRLAIFLLLGCTVAGFLGCLYGPVGAIWSCAILLGLGQGGTFSIANALIVLRSPDSGVAAALSGMVQAVGYLVAGSAPIGAGLLHAHTGDWNAVAAGFVAVAAGAAIAASGAGRRRYVQPGPA